MTTQPPPPPPDAPPAPPPAEAEHRRLPAAWWWIAGAAVVVVAAVVLVVVLSGGSDGTTVTSTEPTATTQDSDGTDPTATSSAAAPEVDPIAGWRQVDPAPLAAPGDQQMNDVAVFGDLLVAAGTTIAYSLPETAIPFDAGGGPLTLMDWEVAITAIDPDAAGLIAAHDAENEPAPDGVRYFLVTLEVTNLSGDGSRNVWADLDTYLTGPDGRRVARRSWCGQLPDALRSGPFEPGEVKTGTTCFAVLEEAVSDDWMFALTPGDADSGETDAAVWVSSDGEDWAAVSDPDLIGEGTQEAHHLAVFDGAIYAAGIDSGDGADVAVWRSVDGSAWDRVASPTLAGPGDQAVGSFTVIDGRLLAGGSSAMQIGHGEDTREWDPDVMAYWVNDVGTSLAALWASDSGTAWERLDLGPAGAAMQSIDQVVSYQGATHLVGRHLDGHIAVLSSPDLQTWTPVAIDGWWTPYWRFTTAGVIGDRLHVMGRGAISTTDGTEWSMDGLLLAADLAPTRDGLLAVGNVGGVGVIGPVLVDQRAPSLMVGTPDGNWSRATGTALVPEGEAGLMTAVTVWDGGYLAVGMATAGGIDNAAVWIGGGTGTPDAELVPIEPTPADPRPAPLPEPKADVLRYSGSWEVIQLGADLDAELAETMPGLWVKDIAVDGSGVVWASTPDVGIYQLAEGTWTLHGRDHGLRSTLIRELEIAADGTAWAATRSGPAYFDGTRWVAFDLPGPEPGRLVTDLGAAPDGMWVGTLDGLAHWDGAAWTQHGMADGLPSAVITDVLVAKDGVWVRTPAGLAHWNGTRWSAFTDPPFRPPFAASPYTSPLNRGIYFSPMWEDDENLRTDLLRLAPNGNTSSLMNQYSYKAKTLAPGGVLYVGTELYGMYVIDGGAAVNVGTLEGVDLFRIGEMWTAPDGTVWMDSSPGLFEITPGGATHHTAVAGLPYLLTGGERPFSDGAVVDMAFAPDGSVWVLARNQVP